MVMATSSGVIASFCPVIIGRSFTAVIVTVAPNVSLSRLPSFTFTFTVKGMVKSCAGVTVLPVNV